MKQKAVGGPERQRRKQQCHKNEHAGRAHSGRGPELVTEHGVAQHLPGEDRDREDCEVRRQMVRPDHRGVPVEQGHDYEGRDHAADGRGRQPPRFRAVDRALNWCQRERGPEREFEVLPRAFVRRGEDGDERASARPLPREVEKGSCEHNDDRAQHGAPLQCLTQSNLPWVFLKTVYRILNVPLSGRSEAVSNAVPSSCVVTHTSGCNPGCGVHTVYRRRRPTADNGPLQTAYSAARS